MAELDFDLIDGQIALVVGGTVICEPDEGEGGGAKDEEGEEDRLLVAIKKSRGKLKLNPIMSPATNFFSLHSGSIVTTS